MIPGAADRLLSVQQAADHLHMGRFQMVELVQRGAIPSRFEGWCLRIRLSDLDIWAGKQAE